jgi:Fe-S cluster assembly protein SufD
VTVNATAVALRGSSADAVETLSAAKQEPVWMRDKRRAAWMLSETLSLPTGREEEWRRTDLRGLDWQDYNPLPPQVPMVDHRDAVPADLVPHMGLPETTLGGLVIHHDGSPLWRTLDDTLARQGVIFCDLDTAVRQHADLVEPHFMTEAVAVYTNKFTAMHAALWNGGTF